MKKERNSSIELLRIFAIFIIILNHYATYSGFNINETINMTTMIPIWLHIRRKARSKHIYSNKWVFFV